MFFDDPNPREGFTIRWISNHIRLAQPSVKLHLDELSKNKWAGGPLVSKSRGRSYPVYFPNRENEVFRFYKKMDMLFRLEESGLLDLLAEKLSPDCIVLFGSAARGEDVKESDVDIFLIAKEEEIDLEKYETALKRKISLHFSPDFNKLPKELRNNIINGIMLRRYLKVF